MREKSYKLFPPRPTLTPLLLCGIALWVGCALSYGAGASADASGEAHVALGALAVAALGAGSCALRRVRPVGLLVVAAALGVALGAAQAYRVQSVAGHVEDGLHDVVLSVVEDSRNYGFGEVARVEGRIGDLPVAAFDARLGDNPPVYTGQVVKGTASFSPIDYAQDDYAWCNGAAGQLRFQGALEASVGFPFGALVDFRMRAIEALGDSDRANLLQALVCGYRRNLSGSEEYQQFQTCGLAHLVAVSGAHLVIVTGLFAAGLRAVRAPRRLTVPLLIGVMTAYYVVAGMPISALRAVVMSALGLLSFFGRRRASSQNAIGAGTIALVLHDPTASVSVSFALSVLSTMGIVVFSPLFQAWLERTPLARVPAATDSLALTAGAALLSQLYAGALFNQLPLVAPLANLLCAPLFPLVCGFGLASALCSLAAAPLAWLVQVATALAQLLSGLVGALSRLPYANVPLSIDPVVALLASAVAAVILWLWWPKSPRMLGGGVAGAALAGLVLTFVLVNASDQIVMLDVGQGDAFLVKSRGATLLVDTGNQDAQLLEQLARNHVVHIDSVLITHADDDHCGSLDALQKAVQVDRVIVAADMIGCSGASARNLLEQAAATAPSLVGVEQGESFAVGAFTARVVWPRRFADEGGNADSLCVVLEYDGDGDGAVDCTALMTGDAEKEQLASLLDEHLVGDVDILKVGHHGSRNGMTREQVQALSPEIALISCGAHNRYGHPTAEILALLQEAGAQTFRTDQDGEVACTLAPSGISVACIP